ncbi:MAG: hypothetical protein A2Z51_08075 [Deltaproteobacteria bacterium RBG_19FT_COMBO_52_11]|jgi:hypothetical protein|nr:MAG: hypothetical protein A2Z51_08075 [Deltaproteobacteria bacterium RBG_19FT_COMBO_52_11]
MGYKGSQTSLSFFISERELSEDEKRGETLRKFMEKGFRIESERLSTNPVEKMWKSSGDEPII